MCNIIYITIIMSKASQKLDHGKPEPTHKSGWTSGLYFSYF